MKKITLIMIMMMVVMWSGVASAQFLPSANAKQIQGQPVSPTTPTNDQSLKYNGTKKQWEPGNPLTGPAYDNGVSGASKTIDYKNATAQIITLSANCTISWTLPSSGYGSFVTIKVIQHTGVHYNITWNATKWDQGLVPLITQADGAVDFINCYLDSTSAYCTFGSDFH
jgi:hypothetical protein